MDLKQLNFLPELEETCYKDQLNGMDRKVYKTIDLCAGIGGIRKGFELTGNFKNVKSVENDKFACMTYKHLYNEDAYGDISDSELKESLKEIDYDVLFAGFPCQTFSAVGQRDGFKDSTRGTMFFHIAEIIERTRPKAFLLENVEGLLTHNKGYTFKVIIKTLIKELGYEIIGVDSESLNFNRQELLLNTKDFGLPQNRPRVYIMGFNTRDYKFNDLKEYSLPKRSSKNIYKDIDELIDKDVDYKYYLAEGYLETLKKHKEKQGKKGNGFGYMVVNDDRNVKISNAILATGGSGKERNLIRQYQEGVAGKVVSNKKTPLNSENIRMMTPYEWAKLQGFKGYAFNENDIDGFSFPEDLSDAQRYKQMGNSVSIPVIEELAYLMGYILIKNEEL